ncbi:hypothetical conserved protein [Candidatus Nitrosoglobus terrae]|uniref:Hypothetical conserved protein n=1 Tax=Candidatus Nitrosoglobus terrae TaxID=1630141 RepID=A0A1Q2SP12_9GAMM|nr:PEP-CTERM sorting domain-containing protein [Candidatus Nitrosoglobus terrae]BAW80870.1 hypothetical conserved protein [Candidatus Nitrosoglobus terrae]
MEITFLRKNIILNCYHLLSMQFQRFVHEISFILTFTIAIWSLSVSTAQATIVFNITYDDMVNHTGIGFDDPIFGAERRNTLNAVFDYLNTVIDSNGTLDYEVKDSNNLPNSSNLAAGSSLYFPSLNGFQDGLAFDHIMTGIDPYPSSYDGLVTFNFGKNWNSSLDTPAANQYDLYSVALHEITHALGFRTLLNEAGNSQISDSNPGVFTTWDSHLVLGDGDPLFNSAGKFIGSTTDLVSNDIYFSGTEANLANGGKPVQVYAPSTWSASSLAHLDVSSDLMYPFSFRGEEKRQYSPIDLGILQDLGYTLYSDLTQIHDIPEPSSLVLFMMGGILLLSLYFRKLSKPPILFNRII